jgi:hypothetical protein
LTVPAGQRITAITATNGTARPIGGSEMAMVTADGGGDMVLDVTLAAGVSSAVNLTYTSLGSFNTESAPMFVQNRTGARIKEMTFTFRDRRPEQTARTTNITIPANAFSGDSGWTLRFDNSFRYGISQNFTLGGAAYTVLVQWASLPTGYVFWFMNAHANVWNTHGRYENVLIKWEAA